MAATTPPPRMASAPTSVTTFLVEAAGREEAHGRSQNQGRDEFRAFAEASDKRPTTIMQMAPQM